MYIILLQTNSTTPTQSKTITCTISSLERIQVIWYNLYKTYCLPQRMKPTTEMHLNNPDNQMDEAVQNADGCILMDQAHLRCMYQKLKLICTILSLYSIARRGYCKRYGIAALRTADLLLYREGATLVLQLLAFPQCTLIYWKQILLQYQSANFNLIFKHQLSFIQWDKAITLQNIINLPKLMFLFRCQFIVSASKYRQRTDNNNKHQIPNLFHIPNLNSKWVISTHDIFSFFEESDNFELLQQTTERPYILLTIKQKQQKCITLLQYITIGTMNTQKQQQSITFKMSRW
ncbi:Hypothetical_protein [Hexamita inflata]|uniref:Hypothetical_protein n=1 Tax=Hexamita inflata TaxID=28002 RepID=A0AA86TUQ3_9EUKA|nr:Hypothetical protein HINF_LOCUS17036 [Hexamita inflata]CAI9929396.1 Hypothetical protein HINF_LOCUS17041 [Hexamita inflata]